MANYEIIELVLESEGKSVFGKMYLPNETREGARVPLVIIAHGLGSNHVAGHQYAKELARRGYAAYCFDFGGTKKGKSTGDAMEISLLTEQRDMEFVYDELSELPYIDLNNVFLMGMSMGGAVAALTAASKPNRIKGLILLYPAFNIPAEIQAACPNPEELPDTEVVYDVEVGKPFFADAYYLDIYGIIGAYRGPVLILHGIVDDMVASGYSVRAANIYAHCQLELIDGVGHGFTGGAFKYAVKKIVGFLDEEADLPDESGIDGDLNFGGGMGGMFG